MHTTRASFLRWLAALDQNIKHSVVVDSSAETITNNKNCMRV